MNLFHYTTGEGLRGIIESSVIRCSHVDFMNDPTEESYFRDVIDELVRTDKQIKNIYRTMYNESYITAIADPFDRYILSLSKNADSLSMWNYYARGNGYNIGLDIDSIIKDKKNDNISIRIVELVYDRQKQLNKMKNFILKFAKSAKEYERLKQKKKKALTEDDYYELSFQENDFIETFNDQFHTLRLSMKHPAYAREEEVRLIISEDRSVSYSGQFRVSDTGVLVEFLSLNVDIKKRLKSVTTHPLNGDLHLKGVKKFIASKINHKNVEIAPSSIPLRVI